MWGRAGKDDEGQGRSKQDLALFSPQPLQCLRVHLQEAQQQSQGGSCCVKCPKEQSQAVGLQLMKQTLTYLVSLVQLVLTCSDSQYAIVRNNRKPVVCTTQQLCQHLRWQLDSGLQANTQWGLDLTAIQCVSRRDCREAGRCLRWNRGTHMGQTGIRVT